MLVLRWSLGASLRLSLDRRVLALSQRDTWVCDFLAA